MTNFRIIFFKFYFEANFPLKKKKKDLVAKYNKFTAVKSTAKMAVCLYPKLELKYKTSN